VFGASAAETKIYAERGLQLLHIGEEAILDLGHLDFKGKQWQNMRTALNRARREGIEFRIFKGGQVPVELTEQMEELEQEWQRRQELPPLEFTLGRQEDVHDPAVEVAVAVDASGRLHGYVDWLPIPAERGWVIDLMRRRTDAMSGTMEFLIGMSLLAFQERGDRIASLAAAPLADLDRSDDRSLVPRVLGVIFNNFKSFYDFNSLFNFKDRFDPRWRPLYLAYQDPLDLPTIALAILRALFPRLGWIQSTQLLGTALSERLRSMDPSRVSSPTARSDPSSRS
jgi:lysylphosphatidylglycerol synthetase-like protein (DUF2156 family)